MTNFKPEHIEQLMEPLDTVLVNEIQDQIAEWINGDYVMSAYDIIKLCTEVGTDHSMSFDEDLTPTTIDNKNKMDNWGDAINDRPSNEQDDLDYYD